MAAFGSGDADETGMDGAAVRRAYEKALRNYLSTPASASASASASVRGGTAALVRPRDLPSTMPHVLGGGRYAITERIGSGAYGTVYGGVSLVTQRPVAIKVESTRERHPQLMIETETLMWLEDHACSDIVPHVSFKDRTENGKWIYTVMDRLGDNLLTLLSRRRGRFSDGTVLKVAHQMICIFEKLHGAFIMHRDVKPENFCLKREDPRKLCAIDFGMSKAYADPESRRHIPSETRHAFMGTARYVSIHDHEGQQMSRRDDIISVGYVCAYLSAGTLPWRRCEERLNTREGQDDPMAVYDEICRLKRQYVRNNRLATELGVPNAVVSIIEHGYGLSFEERPNYARMKDWLLTELQEHGGLESEYDWESLEAPMPATRRRF